METNQPSPQLQMLVNFVIRPPRAEYDIADLGEPKFEIEGKHYKRTDMELISPKGFAMQCSHYEPEETERTSEKLPCVVYLHGNASCRIEGAMNSSYLLKKNITLFCFDYPGCGLSEGEYISLGTPAVSTIGWNEKEDLQAIIEYLKGTDTVSKIGLWGRSMGAATILMHAHRDPSISAIVMDSAFSNVNELIKDVGASMFIPVFFINVLIGLIKGQIQQKCEFNIDDLVPLSNADKTHIPARFLHGKQDNFVKPKNSQDIYEKYAGEKKLLLFNGDHNSERPDAVIKEVVEFFDSKLSK